MSKYSTLPDLDTQPDVYETPDAIDDGSNTVGAFGSFSHDTYSDVSDDEDAEGVVRSSMSVSTASQRFSSADAGGAQQVDFSGTIGRRRRPARRKGALPDQDEYSMVGTAGTREKETPVQKLRRLIFEVEELGKEIETTQKENIPVVEVTDASQSPGKGSKRRAPPTQAQLLESVSALQNDLAGMGQAIVGTSHAPNVIGTQSNQLESGKALLAQLKSFRHMNLSEEEASKAAHGEDPASSQSPTFEGPSSAAGPYVTYELFYTPETAKLTELAKITQVEARLASLERLIGTHFLQGLEGGNASVSALLQENGSLIGALQRLDNHLALLTQPRQLDLVARRVKALTVDMERLADLRKKQQLENSISVSMENLAPAHNTTTGGRLSTSAMQDVEMHKTQTETERRVNYLYSLMEKLDPVAGLVPHLVSRLRGLKSLHTEAAVFSESLAILTLEQTRVSEGFKGIDEAIEHLENSVKANEIAVTKNVEALQGRMEALASRVDKLLLRAK
ncbi:hypothetical protein PhCBS80983_g02455 [Powellomyces hirtus]|uniref:Dynamitin n=1 Tax=Powellomyces hirtus TaxID=109895 RepID=A0A507E5U5_9FUNG|nr:hypothetical protein PhCBS80983_g02455 [Powellomyces hirtus]